MPSPIDAVITWVDGDDPVLRAKQRQYFKVNENDGVTSTTRFADCNEIFYCISAILKNAPFIARIFIVTDNQVPPVIAQIAQRFGRGAADKITVVDHREIFAGYTQYLPTFNSTSIEGMLHRIPNLSERYVYFNDDFIIANPLTEDDFFIANRPVLRGRWRSTRGLAFKANQRERMLAGKWHIKGKLFSYKEYQYFAAKLFGDVTRYFWHDHTPHPFYRPDLDSYFADNDDVLRDNVKFRLRDPSQFDTMSLANALDIAKGGATLRSPSLTYFKATDKRNPARYMARKQAELAKNQSDFLCVQDVNRLPDDVRQAMTAWLDDIVFG